MNRPFWTKVDLTSFPSHRRSFAPDVQRVLVMAAITTVVVAFVALLVETRSLRREVDELRARTSAVEERSSEIGVREMPRPLMPSDVMGALLQLQEGGEP